MSTKDKICLLYDGADNMYAKEATQVKIRFRPSSKNFEKYIELNQDKHIYIEFNPDYFSDIKRLQNVLQFDNWTLQIPFDMIVDKSRKVDKIKFNAIKDCCNRYMFTDLVGNWEVLAFILTLNPSEVYITNMLGFHLPQVKKICDKAGAGVRIITNLAQSAWDESSSLTKFFVRPEDLEVYAPFVSGFEFSGPNNYQEVCYRAYTRGYWYGNLREIIIGLDEDLDSRRLPAQYGEYRLNCKKRCMTGGKCTLCKTMKGFSEELEKINMGVIPPVKLARREDK